MVFKFHAFNDELILTEKPISERLSPFTTHSYAASIQIRCSPSDIVCSDEGLDDTNSGAQQCSQCSSTSTSTSTTTSAYFSCSDSTNYNHIWANSSKFEEDDIDASDQFDSCSIIDDADDDDDELSPKSISKIQKPICSLLSTPSKAHLIESLCFQIDAKHVPSSPSTNCGDLKYNATFWNYVLDKLGLIEILNGADVPHLEHIRTNMDRLMTTIKRLESELTNYAVDHWTFNNETVVFDAEFFLNLAFTIFEQACKLTESSPTIPLVFELDMDMSTDYSFEIKLEQLLNNWVLVYLPSMINKVIQKGYFDISKI